MRASGTSWRSRARCSVDGTDAVVDPEDLPLAQEFAADRLDRHAFVVLADEGQDRLAFGRWGLEQRQVADADEAHLEGARDRGGGEGEDVDVRLHLLHLLFVLHAEPLLLVDDEQAEVLEVDVGGEEAMGSDDAVDLARLDLGDDLLGLAGGEESGQHLDSDRIAGEPVGEGVAVLGCEERGRCEDGDLFAVLDGLERSADGDFGLAEADVAADEAVHRELAFHVGLDVIDRRALVGVSTNGKASSISACHGGVCARTGGPVR